MQARSRIPFGAALAATAALLTDCRGATDIRVASYSEVPCSARARVAVVLAHDAAGLATAPVSAVSTVCAPAGAPFEGELATGTVVVSPSKGKDVPLVVQLMQRPDGETPESCADPTQASKCIFARRQLAFSPHDETSLPIELRLSCLGIQCPLDQTCRRGACVSDVLPAGCQGCTEVALIGPDPPAVDAGSEALAPKAAPPKCGPLTGVQSGAPWPMAGYCGTRAGRSGATGPHTGALKWRFNIGAIASMSPAIGADGTIYIGSNDRQAHAIDPTGKEKWRAPAGGNINNSGFVVGADGTVFTGTADHNVYAFTPAGAQKWVSPTPADIAYAPIGGPDGTIYVTGFPPPQPVTALAAADGAKRWATAPLFGVSGVTVGPDGTLYAGAVDSNLYALRPTDGSVLWKAATAAPPKTPSVGDDGTIYTTDGQKLYAFTPAGALAWTMPVDAGAEGVSIAGDGTIYVATTSGRVHAASPTGALKWALDTGSPLRLPGSIGGDGTFYVGANDGVHAVTPDGRELFKVPAGIVISQPALAADGTLYFVSLDGNLYAVGP